MVASMLLVAVVDVEMDLLLVTAMLLMQAVVDEVVLILNIPHQHVQDRQTLAAVAAVVEITLFQEKFLLMVLVVLVSSLLLILLDKYQKNCYNSK